MQATQVGSANNLGPVPRGESHAQRRCREIQGAGDLDKNLLTSVLAGQESGNWQCPFRTLVFGSTYAVFGSTSRIIYISAKCS